MALALSPAVSESVESWEGERRALLARRISELGLSLRGTLVERLVEQLYSELAAKGLVFRPPVYLSDEWGCPEGTPLIGIPFYLADPRLQRIEEEMAVDIEEELDVMRFLRHEAGHAFNYAYTLHARSDWRRLFGPYSRPYRERYRVDPLSRSYVRHILAWYAQKHPDEDFAETFAVWLTPDSDWAGTYAGWPALEKLEYVDRLMREIGSEAPEAPAITPDHVPVEAMDYTVADHYESAVQPFAVGDERQFDGDLRAIFCLPRDGPAADAAAEFVRRHRRELVRRIAYWTGESSHAVRALVDFLGERAAALDLRVCGLESSTLIELTAFGTAVMMNVRYTTTVGRRRRSGRS